MSPSAPCRSLVVAVLACGREWVPGMVVSQHSGEAKANQYYLRGFNLDHGTNFATTIGGVPVNLPTHGHGQGYFADVHAHPAAPRQFRLTVTRGLFP